MKIKNIDDIEREAKEEKEKEFKEKIVKDAKEVWEGVFGKEEPKVKKFSFFKLLWVFFLLLFLITAILGCVFLIKFFVKDIFF